jgi:hypothetical protein
MGITVKPSKNKLELVAFKIPKTLKQLIFNAQLEKMKLENRNVNFTEMILISLSATYATTNQQENN